jgi:hypothetical protein
MDRGDEVDYFDQGNADGEGLATIVGFSFVDGLKFQI